MVKMYAVRVREGWYIGMTLNEEVDVQFWMNAGKDRPARAQKMVLSDGELPLQVALYASLLHVEESLMDQWGAREWQRYMGDRIRKGYEQCSGEQEQKARDMRQLSIKIWETGKEAEAYRWNASSAQGDIQEVAVCYQTKAAFMYEDRGLAKRLSELLEGRALLESEIESMLLADGIRVTQKELYTALQWGLLHGQLELTNGVHTVQPGKVTTASLNLVQRIRRVASSSVQRLRNRTGQKELSLERLSPYCRRCGSSGEELQQTSCASCGSSRCWTCMACLSLGRSRSCGLIVIGVKKPDPQLPPLVMDRRRHSLSGAVPQMEEILNRYSLSPVQRNASLIALQYIERHEQGSGVGVKCKGAFLLWAVTGAGKTEMMFPLVAYALAARKRVCIATPRRDVVLELKPRIETAFAEAKVATLYGGSAERWVKAEITLATTHQLLRFAQAFDLVVVDELDAFPFHNNPMLQHAAEQACRVGGTFVYLSATPPVKLQRAAKRGTLAQAIVPVRYHRHPLPVPERMAMPGVARCIARGRMPRHVTTAMEQSVARGAQVFVFVARIRHVDGMVRLLRMLLPQQPIAGTSASDAERTEKVLRFRQGDVRVLVTTTILERGVTVPRSDVFILDADDRLFDTSSLVQMAGRAGRSKDDPHGRVVYAAAQWTSAQRGAVRQIRRMNRLAKRGGYLHGA